MRYFTTGISSLLPIVECRKRGYYYQGDLAVASDGRPCVSWFDFHEVAEGYDWITLDYFPADRTWDDLSNKCR